MKLTPLDLLQQNFRKSLKGYDLKQVDGFLELVRSEWEDLLRDNKDLTDRLSNLEEQVRQYRTKEKTLQQTLMTAQRLSEDMKQGAKKEAEIVLGQAELEADKIIHQAHGRLTQIIDEINQIKRQRADFEGTLKGILESHLRLLELQSEGRDSPRIEDVTTQPASRA